MPRTAASWFRLVAFAEAFSWAGLLVGMLLKHVLKVTEVGVQVFGALHGGVFMLYVLVVLLVFRRLGWSLWTAFVTLAAAVPPFATVAVERWLVRRGQLGELSRAPATPADETGTAETGVQPQPAA